MDISIIIIPIMMHKDKGKDRDIGMDIIIIILIVLIIVTVTAIVIAINRAQIHVIQHINKAKEYASIAPVNYSNTEKMARIKAIVKMIDILYIFVLLN